MVDVLRKEVSYSFDEAIKRVQNAFEVEGFSVFLTKEIHKVFKEKMGIENYPKVAFVLGCSGPLAKMALDVSMDIALLMPCSVVIYEKNGKVSVGHISIMKAGVELGLAPSDKMQPVIEETGKRVRKVWDRI
ncbi:MAG: DUF302 domain-containing protein [Candidatus Thorarchaeota archaeon]|nr:DUF302 domain-containing protein [Candidatus Thorarchaeota archaeon]